MASDETNKDHTAITETITVPLTDDLSPSQIAKILRQNSNTLHALVSNLSRASALRLMPDVAGGGSPVVQQIFGAAAQTDAAANAIDQGGRKLVVDAGRIPPAGGMIGRA